MKQTILITSLAHLLFTGAVSADQRMDKKAPDEHPQIQHEQRYGQQSHGHPPAMFDRPPVFIKLLQRKGAEDKVRTYHT